jgi:hypothetical protein
VPAKLGRPSDTPREGLAFSAGAADLDEVVRPLSAACWLSADGVTRRPMEDQVRRPRVALCVEDERVGPLMLSPSMAVAAVVVVVLEDHWPILGVAVTQCHPAVTVGRLAAMSRTASGGDRPRDCCTDR